MGGDKIRMTEYFGDAMKVTFTSTLDHEEDYKWPIEGIPASKYCVTRTAPGKYTSVVKDAEGRESEWKFEFCGQGLKITGRDLKTGCTPVTKWSSKCQFTENGRLSALPMQRIL